MMEKGSPRTRNTSARPQEQTSSKPRHGRWRTKKSLRKMLDVSCRRADFVSVPASTHSLRSLVFWSRCARAQPCCCAPPPPRLGMRPIHTSQHRKKEVHWRGCKVFGHDAFRRRRGSKCQTCHVRGVQADAGGTCSTSQFWSVKGKTHHWVGIGGGRPFVSAKTPHTLCWTYRR